mgnify:CR=1 FL=1
MIELKELTTKVLKMFDINDVSDLGTALMKNLNNKEKLCQFTEIVENNHITFLNIPHRILVFIS